ncbi:site-specific integrase [Bacteroides acidifaciens]|uniref:site-specific integrase n=1 Tax=Bacteroides acidifaciens TaxID=85831 RepID=UPI0026093159|nr:site-specific integrase [Bacteroides acidifaciens]
MFTTYNKDGVVVSVVLDRRTPNKEGKYPVKVKVYHLRKPKYFPTGICMTDEEWDRLERSKSNESIKIRRSINESFDRIKMNVDALIEKGDFSFQALSLRLGRAIGDTFNNVVRTKIDELIADDRIGSANLYRDSLKAVEAFAGDKIQFSDVTVEWLTRCEKFWAKRSLSITTRGMYFRNVRAMMNVAKKMSLIKESQYPFGKAKFEIKTEEGEKKSLDGEQLSAIYHYNSPNETVNKYKDIWIFMYLCNGINPIDMIQLKYSDIVDGEIRFVRQKTARASANRKAIHIEITPEIQEIIDKWGNPNEGDNYIFPFLKGGESQQEIKDKNHDVYTCINKRMREVCEALGLNRITTYAARHSFATILNRKGVPVSYISQQLGHTSIRTTQAYLGSFEREARVESAKILTSILK